MCAFPHNSPVIVCEVRVQRVPVKETGPSGDERHGAVVVHVAQFATVPRLLLTSLVRRCRRRRLVLVPSARWRRLPPRMRTEHATAAARHGSANGRPPRAAYERRKKTPGMSACALSCVIFARFVCFFLFFYRLQPPKRSLHERAPSTNRRRRRGGVVAAAAGKSKIGAQSRACPFRSSLGGAEEATVPPSASAHYWTPSATPRKDRARTEGPFEERSVL